MGICEIIPCSDAAAECQWGNCQIDDPRRPQRSSPTARDGYDVASVHGAEAGVSGYAHGVVYRPCGPARRTAGTQTGCPDTGVPAASIFMSRADGGVQQHKARYRRNPAS